LLRESATAVEQIAISKRAREKARRMNASVKGKKKVPRVVGFYKPASGELQL
jgi:hypothetical protein